MDNLQRLRQHREQKSEFLSQSERLFIDVLLEHIEEINELKEFRVVEPETELQEEPLQIEKLDKKSLKRNESKV